MDLYVLTESKKTRRFTSFRKSIDTLIEQTKTKPQESQEFKLNRSKDNFRIKTPLCSEVKWMSGVACCEIVNTVSK